MTESTFTGFVMLRHKPCRFSQRVYVGPVWNFMSHLRQHGPYHCGTCGATLYDEHVRPINGALTEGACDDRCMSATGDICLCSCGGQNHGSKWASHD